MKFILFVVGTFFMMFILLFLFCALKLSSIVNEK